MKKEQSLASRLKEEISAVNTNAQKKMQLEKEKAEATESEKALVEKSLDAERQKVTHLLVSRSQLPLASNILKLVRILCLRQI